MTQRRHFLKSGFAMGAFGSGLLNILGRQAIAQGAFSNKKLLFLFQRGGNDGINTVIPRGDPDYNSENRPSLFIPEAEGLAIAGNSFAQLHPALSPMMPIYDAGNLAVVHRVGYARQSRSHFDSQEYWERGVIREPSETRGIFYRQLAEMLNVNDPQNALAGIGLSGSGIKALRGPVPFPNFRRARDFNFTGNTAERAKFLGNLPEGGQPGTGVLGMYGADSIFSTTASGLVHATGESLGRTVQTLSAAGADYTPENGAVYPDSGLGRQLTEAALLFKRTDAKIIGLNRNGHDTHQGQGAATGAQANNLNDLAAGFQALSLDLQSIWNDVILVTMTEFGRTSLENGSNGTDHAEASVVFVAGGGVNGGVYNCDASSWEEGAMFSRNERYLSRRTDFRAIFAEIFQKHFGDSQDALSRVIPVYADPNAVSQDAALAQLGILN